MILHQLDLITRYIYANGQKISSWTRYRYRQTGRLDGNTKEDVPLGEFFYHDNHLGSSVLITDKQGKEKTRILYKPFGEIDQSHSVGLNATTMKFTSQELDEETGLYYYGARYYDPTLGRFLNPDSIVPDWYNSQDFNRYAYVRNNPIIYEDPTGNFLVTAGLIIGAVVANFVIDSIVEDLTRDSSAPRDTGSIHSEPGIQDQTLNFMVPGAAATKGSTVALSAWSKLTQSVAPEIAKKGAKEVAEQAGKKLITYDGLPVKTIKHHIFNKFRGKSPKSAKYREFFKKHDIKVDDFTVEMPETFHKEWVHKKGQNWTTEWKDWIDKNPNATTKQVYQQGGAMMDKYGVNHLSLVPYR